MKHPHCNGYRVFSELYAFLIISVPQKFLLINTISVPFKTFQFLIKCQEGKSYPI